jgi:hypothetical protein
VGRRKYKQSDEPMALKRVASVTGKHQYGDVFQGQMSMGRSTGQEIGR